MYSIISLSKEELNLMSSLVAREYATADYRNNHKSDLSDVERSYRKRYFDLVSDLRFKFIFNIKVDKNV